MFRVLPALFVIAAAMTFAAGADVGAQESGERILFVRISEGDHREQIWTVAPDGSDERQLPVDGDFVYMADVSADGRQVVFGGAADLQTMNADGSNISRLPFNIQEHSASWSPDGRQLVFTDTGPEGWTWDLYVANLDGSGRRLLVDSALTADFPDWSPDGRKIAFAMVTSEPNESPSRTEIFTINADGSGATQLTSDGRSWFPDWSPDGGRIAFTSYREGYSAVYTMNADGSDQRPLFAEGCNAPGRPCPGGEWPAWSPDGTRIAFHVQGPGGDIWYANADGTGLTQVTSGPDSEFYPQWLVPGAAATPSEAPGASTTPALPATTLASPTPCVTVPSTSAAPTMAATTVGPGITKAPSPASSGPAPTFVPGELPIATPDPTPVTDGPLGPTPSPVDSMPVEDDSPATPAEFTPPIPSVAASPTPTCPPDDISSEEESGGISPEATAVAAAAAGTLAIGPPLFGLGALAWKARRRARDGR